MQVGDDQLKLVGWPVVEEEINRSVAEQSGGRVHWNKYFGKSLSKAVAELEEQGFDKQAVFKRLGEVLASQGVSERELYRRLLIGVSSRTSEGESRDKMQRHVRHRTMRICAHCKGTGRLQ